MIKFTSFIHLNAKYNETNKRQQQQNAMQKQETETQNKLLYSLSFWINCCVFT